MSAGIFDNGGAAFNPVTVVDVENSVDVLDCRVMDVAAYHSIVTAQMRFARHYRLKTRDVLNRVLDLMLEVS